MHDADPHRGRQRHDLDREGAAVEPQRRAGAPERRRQLVHEADGHAGGLDLDLAGRAGDRPRVAIGAQRQDQGDGEGRARRQPRPQRDGRRDRELDAGDAGAPGRGRDEPAPRGLDRRRRPALPLDNPVDVEGPGPNPAVAGGADPDQAVAVDRHREAEAVVVVGVVADEVDPARRPHDARRRVVTEGVEHGPHARLHGVTVGTRAAHRADRGAPPRRGGRPMIRACSASGTRGSWPRCRGRCCGRTRAWPCSRSSPPSPASPSWASSPASSPRPA